MIDILGYKRVILLSVLLLLNIALIGLAYAYLFPKQQIRQNELYGIQGEVSNLSADIDRIQIQLDQLKDQKGAFEGLREYGFFNNQSRLAAKNILESVQKEARVSSAVASVGRGEVEPSINADKAGYKVVRSPIKVTLGAVDDIAIYKYIDLIKKAFPGHVSIVDMSISRESEVTGTILRGIASGQNPSLTQANIELIWRTMIPESEVIEGAE